MNKKILKKIMFFTKIVYLIYVFFLKKKDAKRNRKSQRKIPTTWIKIKFLYPERGIWKIDGRLQKER